jgi:hypothetical protein
MAKKMAAARKYEIEEMIEMASASAWRGSEAYNGEKKLAAIWHGMAHQSNGESSVAWRKRK